MQGPQNIETQEELIRKNQDMIMLSDIGQKITSCLNVSDINEIIYNSLVKIIKLDGFGIGVYYPENNTITFPGYIEEGKKYKESVYNVDDPNRLAPVCFNQGIEINISDFSTEYIKFFSKNSSPILGRSMQSIIYLPLTVNAKKVGVITIQGFEKNMFSDYHLNILRNIGIYGAIAIENAYLYHQMEKEVEARTLEVVNQKNIIETKQIEIIDSINYAKRIQCALLASPDLLKQNLGEYFILYKPKDIVSGDFYWATEAERSSLQGPGHIQHSPLNTKHFYLAVCDSTGHGVPGAFMSLLNISFLNEAITEKNIFDPGEILNYVREKLIAHFSSESSMDGMDGTLICLNRAERKLIYASANNKPVLIRNGAICELVADKMPIGKGVKNDLFHTYEIELQKGDIMYFYTDGFADQFGGVKGKKFKYKQLNEVLLKIAPESMDEQQKILENTFERWRGNLEQVDDVLLMGCRF